MAPAQTGAPNISARESDVIDAFNVHGQRWIVRENYEPVGRSLTRYNFRILQPRRPCPRIHLARISRRRPHRPHPQCRRPIGATPATPPAIKDFALTPTPASHHTIKLYPHGEPTLPTSRRADLRHWPPTRPSHR